MVKKNSQFKEGEIVVYPKHGVGEIVKIETMELLGAETSISFNNPFTISAVLVSSVDDVFGDFFK